MNKGIELATRRLSCGTEHATGQHLTESEIDTVCRVLLSMHSAGPSRPVEAAIDSLSELLCDEDLSEAIDAEMSRPVEATPSEFRVGRSIGTTIYRAGEGQPIAWVPNNPTLAARIIELLNAAVSAPLADTAPLTGSDLIAAERQRQVAAEGWSNAHDDEHASGEMAMAAACYATPIPIRAEMNAPCKYCNSIEECDHVFRPREWRDPWPFDAKWDKRGKHGRIRQLVIAGALVAAEIDRLQRKDGVQPPADTREPHDVFCDLLRRGVCDCKPHTDSTTLCELCRLGICSIHQLPTVKESLSVQTGDELTGIADDGLVQRLCGCRQRRAGRASGASTGMDAVYEIRPRI